MAIVIAALTLIYRTLNRATRRRKQPLPEGTRIIILVPTSHLAQQVQEHLEKLDPCLGPPTDPASTIPPQALFARLQPRLDPTQCPEIPTSLILLATAKHLASYEAFPTPDLELVCTDEPDTMLGPVPTRHMPTHSAHLHPINRHPPALVSLINDLLGISPADSPTEGKRKPELLDLDFSQRRPIQTVWTSATIHSQIRRFAKTRGWIRAGGQVVDLDFTVLASEKQRIAREEAGKMPVGLERLELAHGALNPVVAVEPEHFALVVDPMTGDISQLSSDSTSVETSNFAVSEKKGAVPPVLLESLAILHATSPPPPGTYALVLPPEGTSIDALSNELDSLGVPNLLLTPEALALGLPEAPGLLIARRSTVTGLHLANLHTIYLLSGLDVSGLSPGQKRVRQGVSGRVRFYDIVSGRVGRLGTSAADGERDGLAQKQRVVSLVLGGGEEEEGLRDMFFGRRSVEYGRPEERDEDGEVVRRRTLSGWDWEGLGRRLEEGMGDEGKEGEEMEEAELVRPGEGMA